jgi:hypothetical protein
LVKALEWNVEVQCLFIDFMAAYDTIRRNEVYKAMAELGIPLKLIRLVKATMTGTASQICVQATLSEPFEIHSGVRQGDALASLFFNVALEKAIKDSGIQIGWHIFQKSVQLLAYADDTVLLGKTRSRPEETLLDLETAAGRIGLKINQDKTKYMVICARMPNLSELIIDQYKFEQVTGFTYLGTNINKENNLTEEVRSRIAAANRKYFSLQKHFKSRFVSIATKIQLYKTEVQPVAMYGAECWTLSRTKERVLDVFERKILRRIYGLV